MCGISRYIRSEVRTMEPCWEYRAMNKVVKVGKVVVMDRAGKVYQGEATGGLK